MNIKALILVCFISSITFGQNEPYSENPELTKDFVLGKFDYKAHEQFTKVNSNHALKTLYLNKQAYNAFVSMFNHAKTEGVSLKIMSGTRNFAEQKIIWERKWEKYNYLASIERTQKILEYSSMPSTSRHHWGTDIDLNSFTNSYFETEQGARVYKWLIKNANNYGFHQVYTEKPTGRTGYNLERWHWSYLPLASIYLNFYKTLNPTLSWHSILL